MKIAVIGTGGVGGYFGGKMAKAGNDVTFVCRGEHLQEIRKNGLKVQSINGDFKVKHVKATDNIIDIGRADLVIVAVKAWQVKEIAARVNDITSNDSVVLPLQNGVMAVSELQREIDKSIVIGGLCRIFCKVDSPGIINHFGANPAIVIGEMDLSKSRRVKEVAALLEDSGIRAKVSDDINADIWRKFIFICVSGLLAVSRSSYGEVRGLFETRKLMIELMYEVFRVSQKMGVHIEAGYVDKTVSIIDTFPYDSAPSLARDVWNGIPSEVEYQNGTVVKFGERLGVDTPVNRFVYDCILPMEMKARGKL